MNKQSSEGDVKIYKKSERGKKVKISNLEIELPKTLNSNSSTKATHRKEPKKYQSDTCLPHKNTHFQQITS